ncbi:hypothetical protein GCM10023321_79310 [Pseudonocardia eucalypti]|uniref:Helix-turn-helix domain-containing protein n=1 Tax=Pseudonocardia eucalypti TaxID=648755 RepID=A0ABP9RCW6_9PSEU
MTPTNRVSIPGVAAKGSLKQVRRALEAVESTEGAVDRLAAARRLREAAEQLELAAVAELRDQGGTWAQIGGVYGTTKQGAQQRFRSALRED